MGGRTSLVASRLSRFKCFATKEGARQQVSQRAIPAFFPSFRHDHLLASSGYALPCRLSDRPVATTDDSRAVTHLNTYRHGLPATTCTAARYLIANRTQCLTQPESYKLKKNYKFGDTLGVGTFGQVKQATWLSHDPPIDVAIKIIAKKSVKGKEQVVYEYA